MDSFARCTKEKNKGFGDMPQQADFFKNARQGIFEKMVSVHTLTLLAILRIVGSEAGQTALSVADSNGRKKENEQIDKEWKRSTGHVILFLLPPLDR